MAGLSLEVATDKHLVCIFFSLFLDIYKNTSTLWTYIVCLCVCFNLHGIMLYVLFCKKLSSLNIIFKNTLFSLFPACAKESVSVIYFMVELHKVYLTNTDGISLWICTAGITSKNEDRSQSKGEVDLEIAFIFKSPSSRMCPIHLLQGPFRISEKSVQSSLPFVAFSSWSLSPPFLNQSSRLCQHLTVLLMHTWNLSLFGRQIFSPWGWFHVLWVFFCGLYPHFLFP